MRLVTSIAILSRRIPVLFSLVLAVASLSATPPAPGLSNPPYSSREVGSANIKFAWQLYSDPNGYQLSSYLLIKKRSQSWDAAGPGDLGASTAYTTTLEPGTDYDWTVAAVDWSQHSATWYQFSGVWSFTTSSTTSTTNVGAKVGFRKPVDGLRDYNGLYSGVVGTGTQTFDGGTLYRDNYTSGNSGYEGAGSHPGVDIPVKYVSVYSAAYGEVIHAGLNGNPSLGCGNKEAGWGNLIIIKTTPPGYSEPIYLIYGHLSAIASWVRVGVVVDDLSKSIGTSGNTGNSCGAHLHFQVDRHTIGSNGSTTFPHPYFPVNVNTPDSSNIVGRYTYNPLELIQDLMRSYPAQSGASSQSPDQIAVADILARASKDSRFGSARNGSSLGKDSTWGRGGQSGDLTNLTWLDFDFSGNRQVRLFHSVRNNNTDVRFTNFFDPDTGAWANWTQVP